MFGIIVFKRLVIKLCLFVNFIWLIVLRRKLTFAPYSSSVYVRKGPTYLCTLYDWLALCMYVWPGSPAAELWVWPLGAQPEPGPPSAWPSSVCPAARSWRSSSGIPSSGRPRRQCCCHGTCDAAETQSAQMGHMNMHPQVVNRERVAVCVRYLPALVEVSDGVLHLSEWAQCLQLPQLHLLHLLLQSRHVVLIRQATAPLDGQTGHVYSLKRLTN